MEDDYFDGCHKSTNTSPFQQEDYYPPDLEGVDEDRLLELQRNVQEQLHKRDEERERNITKRVKEFEKNI